MENWYLACHKAGKQNAFKAQLFLSQPQIDVSVFVPQICKYVRRTDRFGKFKKIIEPLFPGYMFICFDPEITSMSTISMSPGVSHLVSFANTIKPIHDSVVEEIMRLPLCVYPSNIQERKNKAHEIKTMLNSVQHEALMDMVAEKDGLTRSSLLYAFAKSTL